MPEVHVADTVHFNDGMRCWPANVLDNGTALDYSNKDLAVMQDAPYNAAVTEMQIALVRRNYVPHGTGSYGWHTQEECPK